MTEGKVRILTGLSRTLRSLRATVATRWLVLITHTQIVETGREECEWVCTLLVAVEAVLRRHTAWSVVGGTTGVLGMTALSNTPAVWVRASPPL